MSLRTLLIRALGGHTRGHVRKIEGQLKQIQYEFHDYKRERTPTWIIPNVKGGKGYDGTARFRIEQGEPYRIMFSNGVLLSGEFFKIYNDAEDRARKLTQLNPGESFYVVGPISKVKAAFDITVEKTDTKENPPPSNNA